MCYPNPVECYPIVLSSDGSFHTRSAGANVAEAMFINRRRSILGLEVPAVDPAMFFRNLILDTTPPIL
jgi:hypothetical protein